jgi:hypothetical protein
MGALKIRSVRTIVGLATVMLGLAGSLPAVAAAPLDFFGTWMNTNPPSGPIAPCGGGVGVINKNDPPQFHSAGFSNLGGFVFNLVQCFAQPAPNGHVELDFGGGNTLFGTWGSVSSPSGTPLLLQVVGTGGITGGTGSFQGYTGSFTANGYLDRRDSAVAGSAFAFRGQLAPVPEPTTFVLMLAGLGALGALARRRRS